MSRGARGGDRRADHLPAGAGPGPVSKFARVGLHHAHATAADRRPKEAGGGQRGGLCPPQPSETIAPRPWPLRDVRPLDGLPVNGQADHRRIGVAGRAPARQVWMADRPGKAPPGRRNGGPVGFHLDTSRRRDRSATPVRSDRIRTGARQHAGILSFAGRSGVKGATSGSSHRRGARRGPAQGPRPLGLTGSPCRAAGSEERRGPGRPRRGWMPEPSVRPDRSAASPPGVFADSSPRILVPFGPVPCPLAFSQVYPPAFGGLVPLGYRGLWV